jgi:cytochrome c-type biogenesis protein
MQEVGLLAAFIAGIISFLSPCVLPLVPAYISFITGISLEDLRKEDTGKKQVIKAFLSSVFFVLGFTVVFVALGASATWLGKALLTKLPLFTKVAGVLIIIFGLHLIGVFKIAFLYKTKKFEGPAKAVSFLGAFVLGLSFAFGWTPCIGPILAGILTIASTEETVWKGIFLLTLYSLGLGIPFLITSLAINQFFKLFMKIKRYFHAIEILSGILLVLIGILIMTNKFSLITSKVMEWFPSLMEFSK